MDTRLMFSTRSFGHSEKNALASALDLLRRAGTPINDLTVSNPHDAELPYASAAIRHALAAPEAIGYAPEPFGLPSARRAVGDHYRKVGVEIANDQILLTASSSEAYSFLFTLLCDPGDEILIPTPSYPLFEYLARFSGVKAITYRLAYDGSWHIDLESLQRALTTRSRAIVVVNPNNPTGSYISTAEWQALDEIGVPIISDEVFARYPLGNISPLSLSILNVLHAPKAPIFSLDGLSKFAGLPQLKLGWIAFRAPGHLAAELHHRLELIADTYLSVATPVQLALPELLIQSEATHAAIRERLQHNLALLRQTLANTSATVLGLQGGWYATLRLPRIISEQTWVLDLLSKRHVLVQPGWFYDFEDEPYIVLSLLTPNKAFAHGVSAIKNALNDYD